MFCPPAKFDRASTPLWAVQLNWSDRWGNCERFRIKTQD